MSTRSSLSFALALAIGALPACSAPKPEPELASSANHGHYARDYPADLTATTKDFADRRSEARKIMTEMGGYPSKLKDPPSWPHVLEVVERADEDGHSYAYVDRLKRVQAAGAFFDAEKDEISRKVAGAVAYTAKKKSCDADVANAAPPALREAVEKQLEKELHEGSEAHELIDRYRGELGKENAVTLEKQADEISKASSIVHVALVEDKLRIVRMVAEAEDIKRTADDFIAAERTFQQGKKVTDAEKKASQARIDDMNKSKASIDAALKQAQGLLPNLEDEIKKIQREYDDALDALKSKLKDKAH